MKIIKWSVFVLMAMPFIVYSQQEGADSLPKNKNWKYGGSVSLTLTQTGQVNWVQGGEPSMSYLGDVKLFANYSKGKNSWENLGKFAYGQQTQGYTRDLRPSDDRIDISSKYGYTIAKNLNLSALGSFKSQFASGYEYPDGLPKVKVSELFSPAYVMSALGVDFKPDKNTSVFASFLSTKTTFVLDTAEIDPTKYGLDSAKTVRNEIGATVKATHKANLVKNVNVENSLELFSNYIVNPERIDVLWNLKIEMSINKYLKTIFSTTLVYDDDTSIPRDVNNPAEGYTKAIQFKEMLSVGLLFSF